MQVAKHRIELRRSHPGRESKLKTTWTFGTGYAVDVDQLYVSASADVYEAYAPFTALYNWSPELADGAPNSEWRYRFVDWHASSVTTFIPADGDDWWLCALSEEGHVLFTGAGLAPEKVPDAGVFSEGAAGYGYLSDLQQIGEHLYAAGYSGQVYKRTGPGRWHHMDQGILQPAGMQGGQYSIQVINGSAEDDIYVAGCTNAPYYPVRASHWNGSEWRDIALPEVAERITNIHVESKDRIWLCGSNGTLLLGNARDGFRSLSTVDDNQLFLSITLFEGRAYLGSNLGLFMYDPANATAGIRPVVTGLEPELQDANVVDSVEGMLWSIGPKDIARFDGQSWSRIHHPDNPPIGAPSGGATP